MGQTRYIFRWHSVHFLLAEPKYTVRSKKKSPDLSHLRPIWPTLGPNLRSVVMYSVQWIVSTVKQLHFECYNTVYWGIILSNIVISVWMYRFDQMFWLKKLYLTYIRDWRLAMLHTRFMKWHATLMSLSSGDTLGNSSS